MSEGFAKKLRETIRIVPDFPKPGINYFDITTVLKTPGMLGETTDVFAQQYANTAIDTIVGIESRGFIFGATLAERLGLPFIPIRKPGKLPHEVESISYLLEYGQDTLEIHRDAVENGHKVLLIDDLLATGGTAAASISLLRGLGAEIVGCGFMIELTELCGAEALAPHRVFSILKA